MKNAFILILLLSGIVLVYKGIQNYSVSAPEISVPYSTVIHPNLFEVLEENIPEYKSNGASIKAIFLIYTKNCGNCYAEVNDYLTLIREDKVLGESVTSIGILHNEEREAAERLAKITDLPFDMAYGLSPDKQFQETLLNFNSELVLNQLVFFNTNGDLFFRIFLPSGELTPLGEKKRVLDLVINQN